MSDFDDRTGQRPETSGIEYEVLDFAPPEAIVGRIYRLYEETFGEEEGGQEALVEALGRRTTVMAVLAREDIEVVGFKVGFEDEPGVFRSWLGAVTERWRGRGVGENLLEVQHDWCEENGYLRIRAYGSNDFKPMLVLNLCHGFDIVGTRLDVDGELEILLEKELYPDGDPDAAAAADDAGDEASS